MVSALSLLCTVIQVWLHHSTVCLMSEKFSSFIFMSRALHVPVSPFFFNLHGSFEVAGFGLEKGRGTDSGESVERRKTTLVSFQTIHKRPEMIRPISVSSSPLIFPVSFRLLLPGACSFLICNSDFLAWLSNRKLRRVLGRRN